MNRDDPFAGGIAPRLRRIDRELAAVITDAQCRDWAAERPDRVGFARLGQARHEVRTASARYRALRREADVPVVLLSALVGAVVGAMTIVALLGVAGVPVRPLPLAGAVVAGLGTALAATALSHLVRRLRARNTPAGPAPIDDPYLYAGLRRRIEACAVAARGDGAYRRRAAAADLEYALDWIAAAQEELPRG